MNIQNKCVMVWKFLGNRINEMKFDAIHIRCVFENVKLKYSCRVEVVWKESKVLVEALHYVLDPCFLHCQICHVYVLYSAADGYTAGTVLGLWSNVNSLSDTQL